MIRCVMLFFLSLLSVTAWAEDGYIADQNGCKIANPAPKPNETVNWSDGCKDGYAQGKGVMQWYEDKQPGAHYEGELVRGVVSGHGKLTLADGTTYDGGWLDGKQHGTGTLKTVDGGSYVGEWKNGAPDGRGVMRAASGEFVDGIFKEGIFIGPAPEQAKEPAPEQPNQKQ